MKQKTLFFFVILITIFLLVPDASAQENMANEYFKLRLNTVGITSLKRTGDAYDTNYIRSKEMLGDIVVKYRMENGKWQDVAASRMADRRAGEAFSEKNEYLVTCLDRYYLYHADFNDCYADLELAIRFRLEGDALFMTLRFRNLADNPITIGDIILPLPLNTGLRWDTEEMFTRRVVAHRFVSGHGSFAYWMRPNSVGPYLVMTPLGECPPFESETSFQATKLEYFDERGVYIHSTVSGQEAKEMGGDWRQLHTSVTLAPNAMSGSEVTYGFKFRWADGYEGVRDVLYEEGLFDVHVVPGMTVPWDLDALFLLRTRKKIRSITPEYPEQTKVEYLRKKEKDTYLYRVRFSRLGENMLFVEYGDRQRMQLEFFVTEPLEMLIKKRAAHLVARQQHRDPNKWYNGLFSDWDMRNKVLRSPEDTDGLKQYWLSCDDPGLCKAPYIAAKNVHYPEKKEVEAVEYYIENFVWGGLQRTDEEEYAYGIYGIPNWKVNRESKPTDRDGWTGHLWRLYDYPHIIMMYLNMYRIAKHYPGMTRYLDKDGYLERTFGTTKAYFTVPYKTGNWSANALGIFNELVITDVIKALYLEGREKQADWLRRKWEEKVEHFISDKPNYFYAEYPFGPCAFESTQAFARYALEHADKPGSTLKVKYEDAVQFLDEQIKANICLRGWIEPGYNLLGSSRPGDLFYMSQMGGWSVVDYALCYAKKPEKYLRLGYASFLSGWSLMNTGTPESNYGYWYSSKENDGAAGCGYVSVAFGEKQGKSSRRGTWFYDGEVDMGFGAALRTAATIVVDDPLFGLLAYGGRLSQNKGYFEVIPKDGLRKRFHVILGGERFHMQLDRDGFANDKPLVFNNSLSEVRFVVENRTGDAHLTLMRLSGLPAGSYEVLLEDSSISTITFKNGEESVVELSLGKKKEILIVIKKIKG